MNWLSSGICADNLSWHEFDKAEKLARKFLRLTIACDAAVEAFDVAGGDPSG